MRQGLIFDCVFDPYGSTGRNNIQWGRVVFQTPKASLLEYAVQVLFVSGTILRWVRDLYVAPHLHLRRMTRGGRHPALSPPKQAAAQLAPAGVGLDSKFTFFPLPTTQHTACI